MTMSGQTSEMETLTTDFVNQRTFLKNAAAGLRVTAEPGKTFPVYDEARQPEANSGQEYTMPTPHANTGRQFCDGVIGPATLSVAASELAADKATNADAKQFANFELREAIAVVGIMKNLGVATPPLSAERQELLATLKTLPAGAEFDKTFMTAQLVNHEFLRDLADSYLKNSANPADSEEANGRNLAALAITAFKEHVVLAKNVLRSLAS